MRDQAPVAAYFIKPLNLKRVGGKDMRQVVPHRPARRTAVRGGRQLLSKRQQACQQTLVDLMPVRVGRVRPDREGDPLVHEAHLALDGLDKVGQLLGEDGQGVLIGALAGDGLHQRRPHRQRCPPHLREGERAQSRLAAHGIKARQRAECCLKLEVQPVPRRTVRLQARFDDHPGARRSSPAGPAPA
ncbi:hypothetical protein ACFY9X_12485 [Streptomyces nigra]|uniref:hypothetical protein n=1 Tax=Streptomyces nigra TaxID=1827580 RepID=UPI0036E34665